MKNQIIGTHIIFVGESGFPKGLAAIQRITLLARAFVSVGFKSTVVCRKGVGKESERKGIPKIGKYEGVEFIYSSKSVYKPDGFLERNIQKTVGIFNEFLFLKKLKKLNQLDLLVISEMSAFHMFRYLIYSKILNTPTLINLVEMASSMQQRNKLYDRLNDYLIENCAIKMFDGAMPISERLKDQYKSISPMKPCLKVPILCDFEKFVIEKKSLEPYFLYCGSFAYKSVIDFIVKAYKLSKTTDKIKLYLIVSGGSEESISTLNHELDNQFSGKKIRLFSNIPYNELVELYVNANAMLIPLRATLQDQSRFPHKIGEYLASGNPIITTNFGEIKEYFKDGDTALISDKYEVDGYAQKMKFVLNHPEEAKKIGLSGRELGLKEFDYRIHGERLLKFIKMLKF